MTTAPNSLSLLDDLIREGKKALHEAKVSKKRETEAGKKNAKLAKERSKFLPITTAIEEESWIPISQVVQIVQQECCECGSVTEYVAGIMIQQKHKRLPAFRELHAPVNSQLPAQIKYHRMTTPICAHCAKSVSILDQFFSETEASKTQMELF